MEAAERKNAEQMIFAKTIFAFFASFILLGCGDWDSAPVGQASCEFKDFPSWRTAKKIAAGNKGNTLYILDNSSSVYYYKRDNLYDCAFDLKETYDFSGFADDVLFASNGFYIQDKSRLKSIDEKECNARDGSFAINEPAFAVGSNAGIETWDIKTCAKKEKISSFGVLALASANGEYYAVEGISAPANLAIYANGILLRKEPLSALAGNEKNFCSPDRVAANDYGVFLLDKKCKKIGVFDNEAYWRKTISLDSLGIRNPLDIAAGEYSYIFVLHENGIEKVNVF